MRPYSFPGDAVFAACNTAGSEALYRQALEVCTAAGCKDQQAYRDALQRLAVCLHSGGNLPTAEPLAQEALELSRRALRQNRPEVTESVRYPAGLWQEMLVNDPTIRNY